MTPGPGCEEWGGGGRAPPACWWYSGTGTSHSTPAKTRAFFSCHNPTLQVPLLWIRIRIHTDPHSFGSGSALGKRIRIREHGIWPILDTIQIDTIQIGLASSLSKRFSFYLRRYVFWAITYFKYIFVTGKFDQDPDPDGSALVWLPGSRSAARKKAGSGSGLNPSRIHITGSKNCGLLPPQNQQAQWQVVTTVPCSCGSREYRRGRRRRGWGAGWCSWAGPLQTETTKSRRVYPGIT